MQTLKIPRLLTHNALLTMLRLGRAKVVYNSPQRLMKFSFSCLSVLDSKRQSEPKDDQVTAAQNWWSSPLVNPATHGVLQSHPTLSGRPRLSATTPRVPAASNLIRSSGPGGFPSFANPNAKSPFRHLDYSSSATAELRRNPSLSAPDECARACREGEPPRTCYYHFTLEFYTVLGA
jgi:hypothetical protein